MYNLYHNDQAGPVVTLERSIRSGDQEAVALLVTTTPGLLRATFGESRLSPLMIGARYGHASLCAWLLEQGVSVDQRDANGSTALSKACLGGSLEVVDLLLRHGANMSLAGSLKFTPIMEATLYGRTLILKRLLAHLLSSTSDQEKEKEEEDDRRRRINAVLNARGYKGCTALYTASRNNNMREEARLLLQAGASPFVRDNESMLPIEKARAEHLTTYMVPLLETFMEEPDRLWALAKAREVYDARHAVSRGKGGENSVLVVAAVPPCFRGRVEACLEKQGKKAAGGGGGVNLPSLLEALPAIKWPETDDGGNNEEEEKKEEDEESLGGQVLYQEKMRAVVGYVVEGTLVPELWRELKEYTCVRFDERAWGKQQKEERE